MTGFSESLVWPCEGKFGSLKVLTWDNVKDRKYVDNSTDSSIIAIDSNIIAAAGFAFL